MMSDTTMAFPEGKYNVNSTLEELSKCPEAFALIADAMKESVGFELVPGKGMWRMMKNFTLVRLRDMSNGAMPEKFLEDINEKLNKIDIVA